MKILCIGDSITYGAWDSRGGWVARLRERIDRVCIDSDLSTFVLTYNLGVDSDTTESVLARLDGDLVSRRADSETAFLVSLGTNDSVWFRDEQRYWVPIEDFERNLTAIVARVLQESGRVVLVGSAGVDEAKTRPYRDQPNLESRNSDIQRYDEFVARVAAEAGVAYVPVYDAFATDLQGRLNNDGIHPNEAGHQLIAELVWPVVEPWLAVGREG